MPVQLGREGSQEMLWEYQSKKLVLVFLPRSNPPKTQLPHENQLCSTTLRPVGFGIRCGLDPAFIKV